MCSGAVHNMTQLIVTRIFLGIFEATFGAGAPFFLSCLYKRRELGLRMSILLGMSPLANTFASSLAYGITHIKGSLAPWRLLFIIGMTILAGSNNTDRFQRVHRLLLSPRLSTSS
jgi:MFS family permease